MIIEQLEHRPGERVHLPKPALSQGVGQPWFQFDEDGVLLVPAGAASPVRLPRLPIRLHFERAIIEQMQILEDRIEEGCRYLSGTVVASKLTFAAHWHISEEGWLRFRIEFDGVPESAWGNFLKLVLLDIDLGERAMQANLGWRELNGGAAVGEMDRPPEEGGGLLPPYGYPVFGPDLFLGAEHPMFCTEQSGSRLSISHHPQWERGNLQSITLVIGACQVGETTEDAFARYLSTMRRPKPERAIVEINTFWTDLWHDQNGYTTDLASYQAMARAWAEQILEGEKGLVSHFLLDAGWQDVNSLYRPQSANGGPADQELSKLADSIRSLGFSFGLWFSLNGPIGVSPDWAGAAGYRIGDRGIGAGYSCNGGKTRYVCPTDRRWEEDLSERLQELIDATGASFLKGDWDNDAVEDPLRFSGENTPREQLREAIANAMIRIYRRMHRDRTDIGLRGAWWLSPWWFPYVNNTHLPNSGDMEASDLPSLTQRDSAITCRDAVIHHVMVECKSPVPFDVIAPHEFAGSRRNPVQDTEESWLNNLLMWVSRGTHYLQLYLAPYGLEGMKAWSIKETLRWFRDNEDILWKSKTTMVGGNPLHGEIYGYRHESESDLFITLRNPLPYPQALPSFEGWNFSHEGWAQVYPFIRQFESRGYVMASHEVLLLQRTDKAAQEGVFLNTRDGWRVPLFSAANSLKSIPSLHQLGETSPQVKRLSECMLSIHLTVPYGVCEAELTVRVRSKLPPKLSAAVGRYEDDVATFGVPITLIHGHWKHGFAQIRLKSAAFDPEIYLLKIPLGVGGRVHCFLRSEDDLPEFLDAWVEVRDGTMPSRAPSDRRHPPSPNNPRRHLVTLPPF